MKEFMVQLTSFPETKRFVDIANEQNFSITVSGGCYTVNAKSMMAVFGLELSKPLQVV